MAPRATNDVPQTSPSALQQVDGTWWQQHSGGSCLATYRCDGGRRGGFGQADTDEMTLGSHEEVTIGNCGCGLNDFVEFVHCDYPKLWPVFHYGAFATILKEIDSPSNSHWRAIEGTQLAAGVKCDACVGIQASIDTGVAHDMQIIFQEERRRNIRHSAITAPGDVRIRHIALSPESHSHRAFFVGATKAENQSVTNGRCADKLFAWSAGKPDDLSGRGIKAEGLGRSGQYQQVVSIIARQHWSRKRSQLHRWLVTPHFRAGQAVQHDDKRLAVLMTIDDHAISEQHR